MPRGSVLKLGDLRVAARRLMNVRGYTLAVVTTLAGTIGASSAMLAFVDAALLRDFGIANPDRVVLAWGTNIAEEVSVVELSYSNVEQIARESRTLASVAAIGSTGWPVVMETGDGGIRLSATGVSTSFFATLGATPMLGRTFVADDDAETAVGVVVLSHRLWLSRFGGDVNVVGTSINLATPHRIVGVMPEGFNFPRNTDLWTPVVPVLRQASARFNINALSTIGTLFVLGRLRDGATPASAANELATLSRQQGTGRSFGSGAAVTSWRDYVLGGPVRRALWVLLAAVGLLLVVGVSNVSGLMLTRVYQRQPEQAMRVALGGTISDAVRPWIIEVALLCAIGGALGLGAAYLLKDLVAGLGTRHVPWLPSVSIGGAVVVATLVAVAIVALVCVVVPVRLAYTSARNSSHLLDSGRSTNRNYQGARSILVMVQIALSVVLLISALLVVRSFNNLNRLELGFEPSNILTFTVDPRMTGTASNEWIEWLLADVRDRPGIVSAGSVTLRPLAAGAVGRDGWVVLDGQEDTPEIRQQNPTLNHQVVAGDYFQTLRIPLRRGRFFTATDAANARAVAIVSERTAAQLWRGRNPLGQRIMLPSSGQDAPAWRTVVGVVGDVRYRGLADLRFDVYEPARQHSDIARDLLVRTAGPTAPMESVIRAAILQSNPRAVIYGATSMEAVVSAETAAWRFSALALSCFALVALVLASVGLFGQVALEAIYRRREFAIRQVLGASMGTIVMLALSGAARRAFVGIVLGLLAAVMSTSGLRYLLFGVDAMDPLTFTIVAGAICLVVCIGSYIPARLGCRFDLARSVRSH